MSGEDFARLFAPRRVAIVGISRRPGTVGHRCLTALVRHGYRGEIYGVHPEASDIEGVPCRPSLDALPAAPDVAIVVRPPEETIEAARVAVRIGIPWIVAGAGGFEGRRDLEDQLRAAVTGGTRIVGPNTEGLWDLSSGAVLSFGSVACNDDLIDGPAAVVSQSGGVGAAMARLLNRSGLGCGTFVSTGNELDVSATEVLAHLVSSGRHSLVAVYLEGVPGLARFRDLIEAAAAAGTCIAVMKVGTSPEGARAAASHSGRMAGVDALYRSAIADAGGVLLDSLADLAAIARALRVGRPPAGAGLGVIAVSGGTRAMIADAVAGARDLRLARFSSATVRRLEDVLPAHAVPENPVDVTGAVLADGSLLDRCLHAVAEDPDVGAIIVQLGNTQLDALPAWVGGADVPVRNVPVWISSLYHPELEGPPAAPPSLPEPLIAIRALDAIAEAPLRRYDDRHVGRDGGPPLPRPASFLEASDLLAAADISTPVSTVMPPSAQVAEQQSVPAIVKTANLAVHHKAAAGGIVTGVWDPESAAAAAGRIRAALGDSAEPIVVQEFVPHTRELLVGVQRAGDDRFVVLGGGGSATEVQRDISLCLLPAAGDELVDRLRATAAGSSLSLDEAQLVCQAAERLVELHARLGCDELEVNPLVVVNGRAVALDLVVA